MTVRLKFINRSEDGNDQEVVVFQKNVATTLAELSLAWKVIRYCGFECYHPFKYHSELNVSISDDDGNYSPRIRAQAGDLLVVTRTASGGRRLALQGASSSPSEIQVRNDLARGAVNVNVFRSGQLLMRKTSMPPAQKSVFRFEPVIWIGVAAEVAQGEPINSATLSSVNTAISLLGIASADIVMTGGGSGPAATPYVFTLDNVVKV